MAGRIRKRRQERGWSQQKLAEEASVAYGTIRAIETNRVIDPGVFTVQSIATALGVELNELVRASRQRTGGVRAASTAVTEKPRP